MEKLINLEVKCPKCGVSLMDDKKLINGKPGIKLEIKFFGRKGTLHLCQIYECYDKEASIPLIKGSVVEFFCPECHERLITDLGCKSCDAKMVNFVLKSGGGVHICPRVGCKEHFMTFDDSQDALRDMYENFGYMNSH